MHRPVVAVLLAGAATVAFVSPATASTASPTATASTTPSFQVLGERSISGESTVGGTTFGGLTGVDYDAATGTWRASTKDNSQHGPARFYTLNLGSSGAGLSSAVSSSADAPVSGGAVTLLQPDGTPYPAGSAVSPQGIRFDPVSGNVFWADAGQNNTTVQAPVVRESTVNGAAVGSLGVAPQAATGTATTGIRDGEGLSGVTFSANGYIAFSTFAGPLLQDGPNPTATTGALTRIVGNSRTLSWRALAEYAYPLSPLPLTDSSGNGTNQVADIVTVDATHYLVLERATAPGKGNSVRLYEIDTTGAYNVTAVASLANSTATPVTKTLLLDFSTLDLPCGVANFSGLTWGPTLSNGDRSLVLVSDNGFDPNVSTKVLALDVHGL